MLTQIILNKIYDDEKIIMCPENYSRSEVREATIHIVGLRRILMKVFDEKYQYRDGALDGLALLSRIENDIDMIYGEEE